MRQFLIDLITDRLAAGMPDASAQVAAAKAATGDAALWTGPALSGTPLRQNLEALAGSILQSSTLAVLAVSAAVIAFFAVRSRGGFAMSMGVLATVVLGLMAFLSGFNDHVRYRLIASWAAEAASISPAEAVLVGANGGRTSYPVSKLSQVSVGGDRSVYLHFQTFQNVSLAPGEDDYGTLGGVADGLAKGTAAATRG